MSYFTAVIGSAGSGWRAIDVDVEDVESLDELGEILRGVAHEDECVLAVLEREDEWFAIVRADEDEDCRAFVSDLLATERSHYADLLAPLGDVDLAEYKDLRVPALVGSGSHDAGGGDGLAEGEADDDGVLVGPGSPLVPVAVPRPGGRDEDDDEALVHASDGDLAAAAVEVELPPAWAGDPGLLADWGVDPQELVVLVEENQSDPASVIADIGERCGFIDLLDALR